MINRTVSTLRAASKNKKPDVVKKVQKLGMEAKGYFTKQSGKPKKRPVK